MCVCVRASRGGGREGRAWVCFAQCDFPSVQFCIKVKRLFGERKGDDKEEEEEEEEKGGRGEYNRNQEEVLQTSEIKSPLFDPIPAQ